jgi:hypothetical protein
MNAGLGTMWALPSHQPPVLQALKRFSRLAGSARASATKRGTATAPRIDTCAEARARPARGRVCCRAAERKKVPKRSRARRRQLALFGVGPPPQRRGPSGIAPAGPAAGVGRPRADASSGLDAAAAPPPMKDPGRGGTGLAARRPGSGGALFAPFGRAVI